MYGVLRKTNIASPTHRSECVPGSWLELDVSQCKLQQSLSWNWFFFCSITCRCSLFGSLRPSSTKNWARSRTAEICLEIFLSLRRLCKTKSVVTIRQWIERHRNTSTETRSTWVDFEQIEQNFSSCCRSPLSTSRDRPNGNLPVPNEKSHRGSKISGQEFPLTAQRCDLFRVESNGLALDLKLASGSMLTF